MKFSYAVLRFVPDPAKGESVNIGLLVGDEGSGECRIVLDASSRRRANVLADRRTVNEVWSYAEDLKAGLEQRRAQWRAFRFSEAWLRERWSEASNLLQFSPPAPVAGHDIEAATESLAGEFLRVGLQPRHAPAFRKTALVAEVRRAYKAAGIEQGSQLFERTVVEGTHHREVFDFAVANGRAVQLTQAWNFQQENLEPLSESVKAWAWTVRDIRSRGGQAHIDRRTLRVPRDVLINTVYAEPTTAAGRSILEESLHAFRSVRAVAVPESRVEGIAARAARLLQPA